MAHSTTAIGTQGHFGDVTSRIVAIATQGHFDVLAEITEIERFWRVYLNVDDRETKFNVDNQEVTLV